MTFAVPRSIPIFMTWGMLLRGPRSGRDGRGAEGGQVGGRLGRVGRAGDTGTQLLELGVDVLIPPLNVMRAVDQRASVRGEGGEDQRGAGAQVTDGGLRPVQLRRPVDGRMVGVLDVDLRPE